MRFLIFGGLGVAAAGALALHYAAAPSSGPADVSRIAAEEPRGAQSSAARIGARNMLATSTEIEAQLVVLGREVEPGVVEFRGEVRWNEELRPAYGRVKLVCDDRVHRASCWRLDYLEVDGVAIEGVGEDAGRGEGGALAEAIAESGAGASAATGEVDVVELETAEARLETFDPAASEDRIASRPVAPSAVAPPPPASTSVAPAIVATHRIRVDGVNGRAGPGTNFPILVTLAADVELAAGRGESNRTRDWRRYRVLTGANSGEQVWVWDNLVVPASP